MPDAGARVSAERQSWTGPRRVAAQPAQESRLRIGDFGHLDGFPEHPRPLKPIVVGQSRQPCGTEFVVQVIVCADRAVDIPRVDENVLGEHRHDDPRVDFGCRIVANGRYGNHRIEQPRSSEYIPQCVDRDDPTLRRVET